MQLLVHVWVLFATTELQKEILQKNQGNWKMNWVLGDTYKLLLILLYVIMLLSLGFLKKGPFF